MLIVLVVLNGPEQIHYVPSSVIEIIACGAAIHEKCPSALFYL